MGIFMKFLHFLWMSTVTLSLYADYPSNYPQHLLVEPENYSQFFHSLIGKTDKPSGIYSVSIKQGTEVCTPSNGSIPVYYLQISGLPKGKRFQIANRNAQEEVVIVFDGVYLGNGRMLKKNGDFSSLNKNIITYESIIVGGFNKGEPSEFLLIDPKINTIDSVFYLPHPMRAEVDGIKITRLFVSLYPMAYLFGLEGLIPGEQLVLRSSSGVERMISNITVPESGQVSALAFLEIEQKGKAIFEIQREAKTIRIKYPWTANLTQPKVVDPLIILTTDQPPTEEQRQMAAKDYCTTLLMHEIQESMKRNGFREKLN